MNNVRFREARQNNPRKVETRNHGSACVAPQLVVPGIEGGIENERWESDNAHAHVAQTGVDFGDQGNARPTADELCINSERPSFLSRSYQRARTDREAMEKEVNFFAPFTLRYKVNAGSL